MSLSPGCPSCGHRACDVVDTRVSGSSVRRRRKCDECAHRFTTYEHVASGEGRDEDMANVVLASLRSDPRLRQLRDAAAGLVAVLDGAAP